MKIISSVLFLVAASRPGEQSPSGTLHTFASTPAEVLLLGGSKSPAYLKASLDALVGVLPRAQRVELAGCGHLAPDNSGDPARVAQELGPFFAS